MADAAGVNYTTCAIYESGAVRCETPSEYDVDPEGIIRFVSVNDLSVGRNPAEVLRVLDALQTDELCPCNWQGGEETLKPAA